MVKLIGTLSRLGSAKVMVIGDMLMDAYTFGKTKRISPEAPVAVVHVEHEEFRPGGAGNVILNLISLGARVLAVGRIGKDWAGEKLARLLKDEGVDTHAIIEQDNYPTPVKNRVIAQQQQMVRIDHEKLMPLNEEAEKKMIEMLPALIEDVQVIALSDYGKGFLTNNILKALIELAANHKIAVIVDPKGNDFTKYKGSTLIKPNLGEAFAAARLNEQAPLELVAKKIFEETLAEWLMITRSEEGISLFNKNGSREDFPVHAKEVKDVTGAGDTVLAMLSYSIANGLSYAEASQLCNAAAGVAIEHVGCARVTLADVAMRLLEINNVNKVFDEDHLFALKQVLKGKQIFMLNISIGKALNAQGLSLPVFKEIRNLGKNKDKTLLIRIVDKNPDEDFIEMLSAMKEVDFIVVGCDHEERLLDCFKPEEIRLLV